MAHARSAAIRLTTMTRTLQNQTQMPTWTAVHNLRQRKRRKMENDDEIRYNY